MTGQVAVKVERLSKQYRLGTLRSKGSVYDRVAELTGRRRPPEHVSSTMWALRDLSFEIPRGHVMGVLGRNGSGKSTLMKVLAGVTAPTEGWAEVHGRVGALLQVGAGFHPELSGRDNIMLSGAILGMSRQATQAAFDDIVAFSEVGAFLDTPVKYFSSGMYLRLAFSVSAHLRADIMLIDEVMAVGDAAFSAKSQVRMREMVRDGRTILYVSHSLPTIHQLCDSAIVLDRGAIQFRGSTADAVHFYQEEIIKARHEPTRAEGR